MEMNKYCYCVMKCGNDYKEVLENKGIYTVNYKDIVMVVEDIKEDEIMPTGDELLKHEKTIESIMEKLAIIPMSFGHICKKEKDIEMFLNGNYSKLMKLLDKFDNRIELGLKVFWTPESFANEIEDQQIRMLKKEVMKGDKINQLRLSEIGRLVEEKVEIKRDYYVTQIHEKLSEIAYESKLNIAHTPKMVFNSAFLLDKEKEAEFDKVLNDLFEKYKSTLIFKYTGPWPPYNFIDESFVVKIGK